MKDYKTGKQNWFEKLYYVSSSSNLTTYSSVYTFSLTWNYISVNSCFTFLNDICHCGAQYKQLTVVFRQWVLESSFVSKTNAVNIKMADRTVTFWAIRW